MEGGRWGKSHHGWRLCAGRDALWQSAGRGLGFKVQGMLLLRIGFPRVAKLFGTSSIWQKSCQTCAPQPRQAAGVGSQCFRARSMATNWVDKSLSLYNDVDKEELGTLETVRYKKCLVQCNIVNCLVIWLRIGPFGINWHCLKTNYFWQT